MASAARPALSLVLVPICDPTSHLPLLLNRVSTGEFWNGLMHELMDLGHTWAFLYFFTYLILAQFIMLNLVVAVLLINYGTYMAMHALPFESRRPPA